jgi:hypothetical protein
MQTDVVLSKVQSNTPQRPQRHNQVLTIYPPNQNTSQNTKRDETNPKQVKAFESKQTSRGRPKSRLTLLE